MLVYKDFTVNKVNGTITYTRETDSTGTTIATQYTQTAKELEATIKSIDNMVAKWKERRDGQVKLLEELTKP